MGGGVIRKKVSEKAPWKMKKRLRNMSLTWKKGKQVIRPRGIYQVSKNKELPRCPSVCETGHKSGTLNAAVKTSAQASATGQSEPSHDTQLPRPGPATTLSHHGPAQPSCLGLQRAPGKAGVRQTGREGHRQACDLEGCRGTQLRWSRRLPPPGKGRGSRRRDTCGRQTPANDGHREWPRQAWAQGVPAQSVCVFPMGPVKSDTRTPSELRKTCVRSVVPEADRGPQAGGVTLQLDPRDDGALRAGTAGVHSRKRATTWGFVTACERRPLLCNRQLMPKYARGSHLSFTF